MLNKLFNSNSISSLVILILTVLIFWAIAFTSAVPMANPIPVSPLYNIVFRYIGDLSVVCAFITLGLLILEALLINYVLSENDLIPRNSYIAAYIFILVTGLFNDHIILHPVLIANLFIIAAFWLFLKLYEEHDAYTTVFNTGTLISIASMFYFPSTVFILLIWAGFIIYRLFSWREWFISILGFLLPYLFLGSYYFWNDCFAAKISLYKEAFKFINFNNFSTTTYIYIILAVLGLLSSFALFKLLVIINEKAIRTRKFLSIMIWYLIISFASLNLSAEFGVFGFVMMLTSVSVIITLYINYSKKSILTEGVLILLALLFISGRLGLLSFN